MFREVQHMKTSPGKRHTHTHTKWQPKDASFLLGLIEEKEECRKALQTTVDGEKKHSASPGIYKTLQIVG